MKQIFKFIAIVFIPLLGMNVFGQDNWTLLPASGINTASNEIACGLFGDELLYCTDGSKDYLNNYEWNKSAVFRLYTAQHAKTYADVSKQGTLFPYPNPIEDGTGCFNPHDSTLYFSSSQNFGTYKGSSMRIFSSRWNGESWTDPELLKVCNTNWSYMHPWFDPVLQVLVFSSDKPGGVGGMDIWYCYKTSDGWTEPFNPGMQVNSYKNELFPTIFQGDIFFSSNGHKGRGGYDLFQTKKKDQWSAAIQMDHPFNSTEDDMMLFYLNADKGFLTSNRAGGIGGDDIYLFNRIPRAGECADYTGILYQKDQIVKEADIVVFNELKETILEANTSQTGVFHLKSMPIGKRFVLKVFNVDPRLIAGSELVIRDAKGQIVLRLKINDKGYFEFELLPLKYSDYMPLNMDDPSLLSIKLQGKITAKEGKAIEREEAVMIVDDNGTPIAVTRVNSKGEFVFPEMSPSLNYTFRLTEDSKAEQLVLFDRSRSITLPFLKTEATYNRLAKSEAIELIDENNKKISIAPEDVFVINRIYFDYRSNSLTSEARQQLELLSLILEANPNSNIEIISHTDNRGSEEHNNILSVNRAKEVAGYLIKLGISESRITATGKGESDPVILCDEGKNCSESEYSLNRRTEIRIVN